MTRPLLLLSNDDGVESAGLLALRDALDTFADVVVCAPRSNQSATSHSLTLDSVLRVRRIRERVFAIDGTPADCVYVALHSEERLLPRRPDIVVSGMNQGPNLGADIVYSGTVAAAREAAQRGIPAVAISADLAADRPRAAALGALVVERLWGQLCEGPVAPTPLLNVNVPAGDSWPVRSTCVGRRLYEDDVVYRLDPRGREYLWIGGSSVRHERVPQSDTEAYEDGAASVTPLTLDLFCQGHVTMVDALVRGPAG